jgi:hypothetical protein
MKAGFAAGEDDPIDIESLSSTVGRWFLSDRAADSPQRSEDQPFDMGRDNPEDSEREQRALEYRAYKGTASSNPAPLLEETSCEDRQMAESQSPVDRWDECHQ